MAIFLAFIVINLLTALFTVFYFNKKESLTLKLNSISTVEIELLNAIREQENFYNFDLVNPSYFESKESVFLNSYDKAHDTLVKQLSLIKQSSLSEAEQTKIKTIEESIKEFNDIFHRSISIIQERGFKNYGIEGEMRESIHKLENLPELDLAEILMLRRHEKDFIIRQDATYAEKHKALLNKLKIKINSSTRLSKKRISEIIKTLDEYGWFFNQLMLFDRMLGLKLNTGLKKQLNQTSIELIEEFTSLKFYSKVAKEKEVLKLNYYLSIIWVLYLSISILMSFIIAKRFTKRINLLGNRINYFVNSNFTSRLNLNQSSRKDEVGKLWNNFIQMESEIVDYIDLFKEKVDEKTLELSYKTKKIEQQKIELEIQKEETDRKNTNLLDGIRYGWRIQRAMIPDNKRFNKQIGSGFVYFVPKDIVSGDIYWVHKEKNKNEVILSAIDCTGHGVPGAFMSILAVNALNYSVLNKRISEPAKILKSTNDYVFKTMKYYDSDYQNYQTKDGMDMLLCKLNRKQLSLEYSGANRPLYLVRKWNGKESEDIGLKSNSYKINDFKSVIIFEILPTKKTVGTLNSTDSKIFNNQIIKVQKDDMIYLTTDGYADQFGGDRGKKFMIKRLKNLMVLIHDLDPEEQKLNLQHSLEEWKGEEEQVDDITIIGVKV